MFNIDAKHRSYIAIVYDGICNIELAFKNRQVTATGLNHRMASIKNDIQCSQ